jgi:hypothetical protein
VFLELVGCTKLPEALTSEMKAMITHINGRQVQVQVPQKEKERKESMNFSQLGSSQLFENFGKSSEQAPSSNKMFRASLTPSSPSPSRHPPSPLSHNASQFSDAALKMTAQF